MKETTIDKGRIRKKENFVERVERVGKKKEDNGIMTDIG